MNSTEENKKPSGKIGKFVGGCWKLFKRLTMTALLLIIGGVITVVLLSSWVINARQTRERLANMRLPIEYRDLNVGTVDNSMLGWWESMVVDTKLHFGSPIYKESRDEHMYPLPRKARLDGYAFVYSATEEKWVTQPRSKATEVYPEIIRATWPRSQTKVE